MAFNKTISPKKQASSTENSQPDFLETDSPTPVAGLFPDKKAIEKAYKKDASAADGQRAISTDRAKQIMLSLRTLSPLVTQFLRASNDGRTAEQKRADWLNAINLNRKHANEVAQLVTDEYDKPKFRWLLGMCQRFVAEMENDNNSKTVIDWNDDIFKHIVASMEEDIKEQKFAKLSSDVHVKLAVIKASGCINKALAQGNLLHPDAHSEANLKTILDKMVFSCVDAIEALVSPLTPESERHVLFGVLMDEATTVMMRTIQDASEVMAQTITKLEKKKGNRERALEELMEKRPEGYPVDNLLKDFTKKFIKLVNVSKHYHPSK